MQTFVQQLELPTRATEDLKDEMTLARLKIVGQMD